MPHSKFVSSMFAACRFVFAFGAAGILVLITASTALVGVAHNSAFCLGLYSFLMVVLLLAQAALAIAFFTDHSWKKKLPHDETAEAVSRYLRLKNSEHFCRLKNSFSHQSYLLKLSYPMGFTQHASVEA